jgi:hypothetical protein
MAVKAGGGTDPDKNRFDAYHHWSWFSLFVCSLTGLDFPHLFVSIRYYETVNIGVDVVIFWYFDEFYICQT